MTTTYFVMREGVCLTALQSDTDRPSITGVIRPFDGGPTLELRRHYRPAVGEVVTVDRVVDGRRELFPAVYEGPGDRATKAVISVHGAAEEVDVWCIIPRRDEAEDADTLEARREAVEAERFAEAGFW